MAFKLNKTELGVSGKIVTDLTALRAQLDEELRTFNEQASKLWAHVDAAQVKYNERLAEARDFRDQLVQNWEQDAEDKSDKWHDSERGQAVAEFIEQWKNLELDEDVIPEPREVVIEDGEFEHFTTLGEAPNDVGES